MDNNGQNWQNTGMNNDYMPNQVAGASFPHTNSPSSSIVNPESVESKKRDSLVGLILLFAMSFVALVFMGLFVWMFTLWDGAKNNVEAQVQERVAVAVNQNTERMNKEFVEKEKEPFVRFSGPEDYGEVSFLFPKTWSLFIAKDARKGGNYEAYFNPYAVRGIANDVIYALRFKIHNDSMDKVVTEFERLLKDGKMKQQVKPINGNNANFYEGTLHNGMNVKIAVFAIRDKTVVLRTDAAKQYGGDFDKIVESITYNK